MSLPPLARTLTTHSPEETLALGRQLGERLVGGLPIALIGPLGAGTTQFVKGLATGNGNPDPRKITSPTFTLIHEYPGRLRLHHIDAYRLRGPRELLALGFEEFIAPDSAVVVEWADRVEAALPEDVLRMVIEPLDDSSRRFTLTPLGPAASTVLLFA